MSGVETSDVENSEEPVTQLPHKDECAPKRRRVRANEDVDHAFVDFMKTNTSLSHDADRHFVLSF